MTKMRADSHEAFNFSHGFNFKKDFYGTKWPI